MKTLITSIAIFAAAVTAQAQSFELKTNPIGAAFGAYNLSLEVPLTHDPTVTLNASAWHYSADLKDYFYLDINGGASLGIRKYVASPTNSDQGMYIGAASRYISRTGSVATYNTNGTGWEYSRKSTDYASVGFTLGYKFVYERFTIDAFGGLGRKLYQQNKPNYDLHVDIMSGFNFGYRF